MKRTLLATAILSTFVAFSTPTFAEDFSTGLMIENDQKTFAEDSSVNGPLSMTNSTLTLDGAITLHVGGIVNWEGGVQLDTDSRIEGKFATLKVDAHGVEDVEGGAIGHEIGVQNFGYMEFDKVQIGGNLDNIGTLILHNDSQFGTLSNGGRIVTDTGVLEQVCGSSVFGNIGVIQSNTGSLHIKGGGLELGTLGEFGLSSQLLGANGSVLNSLIVDEQLHVGWDDDGGLTTLEAKQVSVGSYVDNNGLIKAETLKATQIKNINKRTDEESVQIVVQDLKFGESITNESSNTGKAIIEIKHGLEYVGDGEGSITNSGEIYLSGDQPLVSGNVTINNVKADETNSFTGLIAKNSAKEKIERLVIDGTLNNHGDLYVKTLQVKNGVDDSQGFNVDNLFVLEDGEFSLLSQNTVLQTITVDSSAELTASNTVTLNEASTITNNGGTATFGNVNADDLTVHGTSGTTTITQANSANQTAVILDKGTVEIGNLDAPKLDVTMNSLEGKLTVTDSVDNLDASVTVSSEANKGAAKDVLDKVVDSVSINNGGSTVDYLVTAKPGTITDGWTANSGNPDSMKTEKNPTMDAFASINAMSAVTLLHEMDSLGKRMGELRDAPNAVGAWARLYGSDMEHGAQHVKSEQTTIQVGADMPVGDWRFGAAFNYTDGEGTFDAGTHDNKNYGFALYGTWFIPCGAYVDLVAKYTRMDNEFQIRDLKGSYDNDAFTLSAETGYRFNLLNDVAFVEPQVQVMYGQIKGDTFNAGQGVTIAQDNYDSLIGRAGVRAGFRFPDNKGTIYARLSGAYEFDGEVSGTARDATDSNTLEADLGGGWLEVGLGANFNLTDSTYTFVDLERTNGGPVKEDFRWTIGVRHSF